MSAAPIHASRVVDTDRVFAAVCLLVPAAALVLFFVYPLATVALRSITEPGGALGLGNFAVILQSSNFWRAAMHSLVVSGSTTAVVLILGLVVAFAVHRCRIFGSPIVVMASAGMSRIDPSGSSSSGSASISIK